MYITDNKMFKSRFAREIQEFTSLTEEILTAHLANHRYNAGIFESLGSIVAEPYLKNEGP